MFGKVKTLIGRLFSAPPENGEKKKKNISREEPGRSGGGRRAGNEPLRKNAGGKKNGRSKSAPAAAGKPAEEKRATGTKERKAVIPQHPEKLTEVPVCEGKKRFLDYPLHEAVQFGIQHAGFEYCTPIQELTLPPLMECRDLAGRAQTGTGKTAAFLLASFTRMLNQPLSGERGKGTPRMVVMAPTRELAMQIHKDACELGIYTGLSIAVVFGGMDHDKQRASLDRELDVLIGTPGRIIDYSCSGALHLNKVEILVIDEADRMLDMGFIPDVRRIVAMMPRKGERQTLLFSATLDEKILRLASGWLADPVVLESEPEKMVSDNIRQTFYSVSREEKLALLLYILRTMSYDRIIIFGNRKDVNSRLQYDLARYGFDIPLLSGDISQDKRIKILESFRSGRDKVVIATDVAARGIHVDDVSIVINYDLPEQPEDYIHRIGRTGRAGHTGTSISFLCEYGAYYLPPIEEMLGVTFSSILPTEEMLKLPEEAENPHLPKLPSRGGRSAGPSRGGRRDFPRRRRRS